MMELFDQSKYHYGEITFTTSISTIQETVDRFDICHFPPLYISPFDFWGGLAMCFFFSIFSSIIVISLLPEKYEKYEEDIGTLLALILTILSFLLYLKFIY
jgi:hypothetical protein